MIISVHKPDSYKIEKPRSNERGFLLVISSVLSTANICVVAIGARIAILTLREGSIEIE